ncbi:hexose transporter 2 [Fusarium sporotrichioides]|uniref:Hexose transporter 2 n=1 Tax=Fusarium sporotrichioides TaxID=5514 RepID=A0A395REI2_FUSSP|nr:hexose transporter 2 [Fusarium sporotrichioides]
MVGRRVFLLIRGTGMAIFLFVVGSVRTLTYPNETQRNSLAASFMLFSASYALAWAPVFYAILSEAAWSLIKEKTNLLASLISILNTFVTSLHYLIKFPLYQRVQGQRKQLGEIIIHYGWKR